MANILERADAIVNHRSEEKERRYGPFSESMEKAAEMYNLIAPPRKNHARRHILGINLPKINAGILFAQRR